MSFDVSETFSEAAPLSREPDGHSSSQLTFEIYLDDARYLVPTLKLVAAPDEAGAIKIAQLLLEESAHHRGVEVCQGGQRVAALGTYAERR